MKIIQLIALTICLSAFTIGCACNKCCASKPGCGMKCCANTDCAQCPQCAAKK